MSGQVYIPKTASLPRDLTDREKSILRSIIHLFILNANPIGSRSLSKYLTEDLKLSAATIRNVMSDLEELELISHPHTSAGRVPTDKGYRYYVDSLMDAEDLSKHEIRSLNANLAESSSGTVLKDASKVLGMISRYLSVVEIPHISGSILQKLELVPLSSNRLLVVLELDSEIVKTVTLEAHFDLPPEKVEAITRSINEKISGKSLKFIRENFRDLIKETELNDVPLIRLFVENVDELFSRGRSGDRIHIAGTPNLLKYPEFEDIDRVKGVIELVENEDVIIHLLDQYDESEGGVKVFIGNEMQSDTFDDYSMIVTDYNLGSAMGSIGLIGPKRMNYSKMMSLVKYVSDLISKTS